MAENFVNDLHDGLTHSEIVHKLLNKITTELAVKEFRGGYKKPVTNGGITYMDYVPDSRAEYIQSIEALSDILLPQYDDTMTEVSKEYIKAIEKIEEENSFKDIRMGDDTHTEIIRRKLKLARELFRKINLLLKRTNYLKTAPATEDDDDEEEEEE